MPTYVFICPKCKRQTDKQLKVAGRDQPQLCTCGGRLRRKPTMPMATLWRGKFQGRWNKVAEGDW